MLRMGSFLNARKISHRFRATTYLTVAQLFLQDNFLLERPLTKDDIKPRLLGHWGTCPGINFTYACLKDYYKKDNNFSFVLGPGHGFPALQANLFIDGELAKVDKNATRTKEGIAYICKNFSWPGGFPSHSSPITPGIICEGGELGYALATSYGYCLGHPERTIAVMIGDGEFETATALASLNLNELLTSSNNGKVLPILHLNGYKISAPTIAGRKSQRELAEMLRGFGFTPIRVSADPDASDTISHQIESLVPSFGNALDAVSKAFEDGYHPFIILETPKGMTGPDFLDGQKIAGNFRAHQIPLPNAKTDDDQLALLNDWLASYHFEKLFDDQKGFKL